MRAWDPDSAPPGFPGWIGGVLLALVLCSGSVRAVDRFDVFLGYDTYVPEASWFPIVCEIENKGPGFSGVVEVTGGSYNEATKRLAPIELPTGTTKRITLPVFFDGGYGAGWNVRLLDARGRVQAEQNAVRARKQVKPESVLLGSVSRNDAWTPAFQPLKFHRLRDVRIGHTAGSHAGLQFVNL